MNCKNENEVNKISGFNLLHDIINPSKLTKSLNSHYSLMIYGCMNTQKFRANFNNF